MCAELDNVVTSAAARLLTSDPPGLLLSETLQNVLLAALPLRGGADCKVVGAGGAAGAGERFLSGAALGRVIELLRDAVERAGGGGDGGGEEFGVRAVAALEVKARLWCLVRRLSFSDMLSLSL